MKRNLCIILTFLLCLGALFPISASAETFKLSDTDISLDVNSELWYVFTRDNIVNNPELDELYISYDAMSNNFQSNGIYMDALLFLDESNENYVELFVRKKTIDSGVANLSNYDDDEVMDLATELAEAQGAEDYSVYESDYKFAKLEYIDAGMYLCEYVTIVNKDNYTLTFQSTTPYTDAEYEEIEEIVNSIEFDVDTSLKEEKKDSIWDSVITKAIGGAIGGGLAGFVISLSAKKRKNKNAPAQQDNITNENNINT